MADEDEELDLDVDEAAEAERDAKRLKIGLGAAAVVVLAAVAALGLLFPGRPTPPGAGQYIAGSTDEIQADLPALKAFVERTRGLTFTKDVAVTVLADADFRKIAAETLPEPDGRPAPNHTATAHALGLAHPGRYDAPSGTSSDPAAFYSYTRHTLYLHEGPFDAFAQAVLVHELTHALQDQHFDLLKLAFLAVVSEDQTRALSALVEGDATRVELAYVSSRTPADKAEITGKYDYDPEPADYAGNVLYFPYTVGRSFVESLYAQGGNAAVDKAFGRPPVATSQIIDPRLYADDTAPIAVRPPDAKGPVVDTGSLGRFGLAMMITNGKRVLNAGGSAAVRGDAYVTYKSGAGYCTAGSVIVGDVNEQTQMFTDLSKWLRPGKGALEKYSDNTVRYRSCT